MKILIIGSGGREHALAWKLVRGGRSSEIVCAPGNPGMSRLGRCEELDISDTKACTQLARKENPNLVIIGPEAPAAAGLADKLQSLDIPVFGPSANAARIESSKSFAKGLMHKCQTPTSRHGVFSSPSAACAFLEQFESPYVVKADGLAAGKGVVICETRTEAENSIRSMLKGEFGKASQQILIEEFLPGEEASFFALSDGDNAIPLASAQDYKRAYDGDSGPNTGGMGAVSPAPGLTPDLQAQVMTSIIRPIIKIMAYEGCPFRGVLYAGLMIGADGIARVIEFNARFGDPECQAIMLRLEDDILPLLLACATGGLGECSRPEQLSSASACVVMSSEGYPGVYKTGEEISGIAAAEELEGLHVFHAGTRVRSGQLVTNGGRVLGISARGEDTRQALERAYQGVERISWPGSFYRRDIGWRGL